MAYGDEIYSDESMEQRAKVVQEALGRAQRAQDARDQLAEATAVMLVEMCVRVGSMGNAACAAQRQALDAVKDLRENTGRDAQGKRV